MLSALIQRSCNIGRNRLLIFILFALSAQTAHADYRLGFSVGYGGTGIATTSSVQGQEFSINRSDGPLVLGLTYELPTTDKTSLAVDHTRGITFSPFSSGVGFTGVTWRWYFWGEMPTVPKMDENKTYAIISRRIWFAGLTTGLANGVIHRDGDLFTTTAASSLYYGTRIGYDQQVFAGQVFRAELFYAQTPGSTGLVKSTLSAFALEASWLYLF